jgi:translation initiation factor 3 subunit L
LHALVKKAGINLSQQADEQKQGARVCEFFKQLGDFSVIGLSRVHCLLGDYIDALSVLTPVNISDPKRSSFGRIVSCHVSLFYYMSFSYLMLRRYSDCGSSLVTFLNYFSNSHAVTRLVNADAITKNIERIHGILGLADALAPQDLDDSLQSTIKDKHLAVQRLAHGDINAFEQLFSQVCPKFVVMRAPNYNGDRDSQMEAHQQQLNVFLNEVRQRQALIETYPYLRLCTSMTMDQLANYLKTDIDSLGQRLMLLKHKSRALRNKGGPPIEGVWEDSSRVRFGVDNNMIHLAETAPAVRYGEYFIRQIVKCEDLMDDIRAAGKR